MNIMLHSLGRELPEDVVLINYVRQGFQMYQGEASDMVAVFDFVELFGANADNLLREKIRSDEVITRAKQLHLEKRYEEALAQVREAREALVDIQAMAIDLKNQALLWVYLIEWAAVTATSLLAGLALYGLMLKLKRKLYRDVGMTRLAQGTQHECPPVFIRIGQSGGESHLQERTVAGPGINPPSWYPPRKGRRASPWRWRRRCPMHPVSDVTSYPSPSHARLEGRPPWLAGSPHTG